MVKAEDIIKQLHAVLPTETNLFSDDISVTSLTRAGGTVTVVTATAHGLTTGDEANIVGAQAPINITSLTQVDGVATAVTDQDHDLTEGWFKTVDITGANEGDYNGTKNLIGGGKVGSGSIPNRQTFKFTVDSGATTPATGTITLVDATTDDIPIIPWTGATAYNGRHTVTVIDPTTFTYPTTTTLGSPAQGTIILRKDVRVSGAVSVEKAIDSYTRHNDNQLWGYVVLGNVFVSKDRKVATDATETTSAGDEFRQRLIMPFSVHVITPTKNDINGRAARDQMEDVFKALLKSILRVKFDSVLVEKPIYNVTAIGHQFTGFFEAYYLHEFQFETVTDITLGDTVDEQFTRAFRDIDVIIENDTEDLEARVNLDDEPLP